ncbi:AcrR family transcriptional regulator [Friedmanniella endophytica]|uniref:AcrR family transcriptional regulator n=1 Tax=Microlunatus kandeliicorticis TaxID=1759536 RepID=A0A7W3P7K4_9ACTN|nr:TetR/AcrR family transcriptional regulator [Microlunatus kandeliicorticis]MBA8796047.1 AcrR family transcriptional regulator [Microlunatus kandeliicorticis]
MPRWEPDARERFVAAALQLFSEQGYDETTVAQIADRAGLTRSTFHRHFSDKREVLAAGQETLSRLFAEGIAAAPGTATPLEAVSAGLVRASGAMTSFNREIGPRIEAVIATSAELQERALLKKVGMAAAIADALRARGVAEAVASTAAELGVLAFKEAFAAWSEGEGDELAPMAVAALDRYREAAASLG